MKVDQKKIAILLVVMVDLLIGFLVFNKVMKENDQVKAKAPLKVDFGMECIEKAKNVFEKIKVQREEDIRLQSVVFDNMTMEELSEKLEKSMNSTLKGKGSLFASYSIELGLDPYLALAIVLHETGCSYSCSGLVQSHNNIGGLKGGNGRYLSFATLDDGIKGYLKILYKNYYSKGLTTPELMNPSYAASKTWASRVNWYIGQIKAK